MTLPYAIRRLFVDLPRPFKQMLAIVLDAVILLGAFHLALWLRFELFFLTDQYLFLSLLACAGGIAALAAFGVYLYILRYMSERVLAAILGGIVVSVMVVTAGNTFLQLATISRGVLVLYAALALVGLIGVRLIARKLLFPADHHMADPRTPVLIYGAGGAGSQLAMALRAGPHYRPVAMLDDDKRKHRLVVNGLRVYPPEQLPKLIDRHNIRQLLIAMPSAPPKQIRSIVEAAEPYRLRIRLVPSMRELIDPTNGVRLRDVQVEDLLGRDPVAPIDTLLGRCVTDRIVMVTGAGGSIGSELCRQILALRPRKLVLFEIAEPALYAIEQDLRQRIGERNIEIAGVLGSVRDAAHCLAQLQEHGVQTIYHAAAYKHVPIVEHNVSEGIRTNAFGTLNMAETAIQAGVLDFVLISTDKAVRPTNVMGASKRLAELVLQAHAQIQDKTRFSMVRFGNVLGSSGSVVPLFRRQILEGGPITLTHPEITRYFMTIPEAAQLVLQAGAMGESGSVFVLDMGEPVLIRELAERMVRLYGLTVKNSDQPDGDIEIRITGLRPGEKLYEELLIGEDSRETLHPRIMRATEYSLPYETLMGQLRMLDRSLQMCSPRQAAELLGQIVREYASVTYA
ncbi:O-antigen biosynthesis protein WlbL [Bordetella bronchiseptica]|uniref:O-antigen biosynthesis protein WlbL n=1 Tax=Bordetella bronchiseptica TaxID=518 RepID=UPI00053A94F8|nr:O-antigen biosynthesis protein WlbL [Bordetella bronchiseptica]